MKRYDHPIRVKIRVEAARVAGKWFEQEIAHRPQLRSRLQPDSTDFLAGLSRRSSPTIKLERAFAQRFVDAWAEVFNRCGRSDLLLQIAHHEDRAPVQGVEAIAELVGDIASTLRRGGGRPEKVDPLEALDAVKSAKKTRQRKSRDSTIELAAEALGVSVNTAKNARKKGKAIVEKVRAAIGDAEPIVVLTEDGSCGVAIVKKKEV